MKRILITLTLLCVAVFAYAQKGIPAGQRYESVSLRQNDDEYAIFKYKDEDGTVGYYLSLGHTLSEADISIGDLFNSSFKHTPEACLCLGANAEEAFATLDDLREVMEGEIGDRKDYPARITNGVGLFDQDIVSCTVVKPFIGSKRLCFVFLYKERPVSVELTKGSLKSLRNGLKFHLKIQPD